MDFESLVQRVTQRFTTSRATTEKLAEPLSEEDCLLQAMADVSPTKWHLAHTSWFYEQFLLLPYAKNFHPFRPDYSYLFNSYYEGVGTRVERPKRGLLSRPALSEVRLYRKFVTGAVQEFISEIPHRSARLARLQDEETLAKILSVIELGINHEEQHQELVLTDIKYNLFSNPQRPAYSSKPVELPSTLKSPKSSKSSGPAWISFSEGIQHIGFDSPDFAFDNERPRHRVFLEDFQISSRSVSNGEYLEFIEANGYQRPDFWLSDGWAIVQKNGWTAPLYWEKSAQSFTVFTLQGMQPLNPDEPIAHLSHYEADAYARFRGRRLPSEMEWEVAATHLKKQNGFPMGFEDQGQVWEWTSSAYLPYPGFQPFGDGLGEYNGKFMSNQMVLRGGSQATPRHSLRPTYRNFFPPESRWQFTGARLAQ